MTIKIKETGPQNVPRPFRPSIDTNGSMKLEERQVEALEHIAVSLSAIDASMEQIAKVLTTKS